jgi:hypothetical protein
MVTVEEVVRMTPAQKAIDVQVADEKDVQAAIRRALKGAGVSCEELVEQARTSRFASERARLAWFVISPFVEAR